jgi:pimeloyl-ACP methyl ester carboxylesterase
MRKILFLAFCLAVTGIAAHAAPVTPDNDALAVVKPRPKAKDEVKYATIELKAADGTVLQADWWAPKGSDRAPAALLIHEAGADRTQMRELGNRLYKSGYAVLCPDLRGHGESVAKPEDAFTALKTDDAKSKLWAFATRDIEASARWLRTNKKVHSSNLNLFGMGTGSALAVRQAARDDNVRSVTLLAPREKMLGFDLAEDLFDLEGVPTFLIASKEGKQEINDLAQAVQDELGCAPFIKVETMRAKTPADLLGDRKLASTVTKPLKEIAFPTRRRR